MEGMLDTAIGLPLVSHMSGRTSRCQVRPLERAPLWHESVARRGRSRLVISVESGGEDRDERKTEIANLD
jgi:hypothetical protein